MPEVKQNKFLCSALHKRDCHHDVYLPGFPRLKTCLDSFFLVGVYVTINFTVKMSILTEKLQHDKLSKLQHDKLSKF